MQYQVPQFTETESKLIGPFTLKQFGWFALSLGVAVVLQFILSGTVLIVAIAIDVAIAAAMAYVKVGGTTLPHYVWLGFMYFLSGKRFLYNKEAADPVQIITKQPK
jgi:hypothetical protein